MSLRGIMECDLKTFCSSSAPSFHPSASPPRFCSLSLSLLLSSLLLPPSPGRRRGVSLHALIGFIGSSSVVEDAAVALDVVLDKVGSAHNIRQSSSLFHLIKKTTFDGNRNILRCQADSCRVIHLLTVSPMGLQPGDLFFLKKKTLESLLPRRNFCVCVCVCVCVSC